MAEINQGALPQINRNDPDYIRKVSELANNIASGNAPTAMAPTKPRDTRFDQTLFDDGLPSDPPIGLPGDETAAPPSGRKTLKFIDDIGDEQEFEVDYSDDKLTEIARKARRTENLEQEMAALRDEMAGLTGAAKADMEKARRYLELEKSGSREAVLDELFRDIGGYEGFRKQLLDEHNGYEKMTAEERRDHDIKRIQADSARKMAELEKRLTEKERSAEARTVEADRASKIALLNTVYSKYRFDNADSDPAVGKINEMIFNEAQASIRKLEAQRITVTENILNREFKKAQSLFKGRVNTGARTKIDAVKELANQADAAGAAAQTLQSQTTSGSVDNEAQIMARWINDIKTGNGLKVTREVASSDKLQNLYAKFANMISRDRGILTRK